MEKILGNSLTFKTFSFLKVNDTEIYIPELVSKAFPLESDEKVPIEEFNQIDYGVSKEVIAYNRKFENLYRYYEGGQGEEVDFGLLTVALEDENNQVFDNHDIVAKKASKIRLIIDYRSSGNLEKFRSSLIRVLACEDSEVDLFIIQRDDEHTRALESIAIYAKDRARVRIHQYELGASKLYTNFQADLIGSSSSLEVDSIYFAHKDNELNMLYNVYHHGRESQSDLLVNGALKDRAYKNLKSNLDFKEGSTSSKGSEEEYTILLDDSVTAISVPLLLCHEDDVEGNHAASAGKLDSDKLFYIMARGFSEEEAIGLMIESKFASAIDKINNQIVEKEIWDLVHKIVKS